jgi:hypothetical protein
MYDEDPVPALVQPFDGTPADERRSPDRQDPRRGFLPNATRTRSCTDAVAGNERAAAYMPVAAGWSPSRSTSGSVTATASLT